MDGFANHNRLYYHRMWVSIKVMLMIDYITISLAVIVCLVMWWSFLAISGLKRSCPNRLTAHSGTQKNEAPKLFDWISYIYFHAHFYKTNISFTRPDFVPQRVIWPKGYRNRFDSPLSPSIAVRRRKDCHRSRPVYCIMRSRLSQSALLAIKYHNIGNIFKLFIEINYLYYTYNLQCLRIISSIDI